MTIKITLDDLEKLVNGDIETAELYKLKYLQKKVCPICGKSLLPSKKDQIYCRFQCCQQAYPLNHPDRMREIKREWARKKRAELRGD